MLRVFPQPDSNVIQSAYINIAIRAARLAGDIMRREQNRLHQLHIKQKSPNDFVSEVDLACEAVIIRCIQEKFPDHCIIAEESGQRGNAEADYCWIIDPLDGTSNYLHGIPHFAVSIAIKVKGRIEHGVVYDPMREELYVASRGEGAILNDRRIRCSNKTSLDNALLGTGFPFRKRRIEPAYQSIFSSFFNQCEDLRRTGSAALDLAYVAAGRLDGFFEIGLHSWDMAAGALLVREAGGVVVDFAGGNEYLDTGNIIAAPFKVVPAMLKTIKPHCVAGIRK